MKFDPSVSATTRFFANLVGARIQRQASWVSECACWVSLYFVASFAVPAFLFNCNTFIYFCRMLYPVEEIIPSLKASLASNKIVILQAPPGAGKSTIVPLRLADEPWLAGKKIMMLEPRRLAARSVAMRMSELNGDRIGEKIGYRVRFESKVSAATQIEVVTEGILTRMIQNDNALEDTGLIIFDEFHERNLQGDLALVLSLQLQQLLREDIRILIMSATLDSEKLSQTLRAPVVTSLGRQFPVAVNYLTQPDDSQIHLQMSRAIKKALRENEGDILAFLPGAGEITRTAEILQNDITEALIFPLFGDLPFSKQQEAILPHPSGRRKVVLTTSIAETSLTIEGIKVVIDSGLARVPRFDPRSGLSRLETIRVTLDAADQRAGRAGRLGPGVCYRLWTQGIHGSLVPNRKPEILEADLAPLMLELYQWGVKNIRELTWLTPPPEGSVNQAKELLRQLEAVKNDAITLKGREMLTLPTHPRIAHMLLEAKEDKLIALAADVAALLEERDPLPRESGADLGLRISALRKWRAGERVNAERSVLERVEKLAQQWRRILKANVDNSTVDDSLIGGLVMLAYPERIARQVEKDGERYKLVNGRNAKLPSNDPLTREQWIAISTLDAGMGEAKIFSAAPINYKDLFHRAVEEQSLRWDDERGMVVGTNDKKIGSLVLESKPLQSIDHEKRTGVLCSMIREKGLHVLGWDETLQNWQARVSSLLKWRPEDGWPDVSEQALLDSLESWLGPFLSGIGKLTELQKLNAGEILNSILSWEQQNKLDVLVPTRIEVPSDSMIKVNYFADGSAPTMEVRLQEVFGMLETPKVNEGRMKIVMHLLSPGFKPVQVTQDLRSFWQNTYAEVRKELRTRYPKHSWPEDPWTAKAVRGAKRRA
jgi:ATP-dependent helicase HrpB